MKLFPLGLRWTLGRQGTGYRKLILALGATWDAYIVSYPVGTMIPTHTDPVPGKRHWRMNIRIQGEDTFEGAYVFRVGPLVIFRPDVSPHSVGEVSRPRTILSVGWTRPLD